MINDIAPISVSFQNITKHVRESDTPSKSEIIELTQMAHQAVIKYLQEDNMAMAIDTMQKTKAIEDYVKAKIRHQHGELSHANLITKCRFDMIREIGWWLDENLVNDNDIERARGFRGRFTIGDIVVRDGKPKFFLKDLGITEVQSYRWQYVSRIKQSDYENWVLPYLKDGNEKIEKSLYFERLISAFKPSKPKEPEEEVVAELDPVTKKFYLSLKSTQNSTIEYFEKIQDIDMKTKDFIFIDAVLVDVISNLTRAHVYIKELLEINNAQTSN